jgi:hypothetical protein
VCLFPCVCCCDFTAKKLVRTLPQSFPPSKRLIILYNKQLHRSQRERDTIAPLVVGLWHDVMSDLHFTGSQGDVSFQRVPMRDLKRCQRMTRSNCEQIPLLTLCTAFVADEQSTETVCGELELLRTATETPQYLRKARPPEDTQTNALSGTPQSDVNAATQTTKVNAP